MSFELPPELWLHIFEEFQFPLDHLPQIQSVCRLFRNVSRPLLFSEVTFTIPRIVPMGDDSDADSLGSSNPDDLDSEILDPQHDFRREFEKLEFWTSETISPHVRRCDMSVLHTVLIVWDSPLPILSACFKAISQFTNLRTLLWSAESIDISYLRVDALPSLKRIHIISPAFVRPFNPIPNKLQLTYFSYIENSFSVDSEPSSDAPSYLSFLDPVSLRFLHLQPDIITIPLQRDRILMSSFQNLHTLELMYWNATTLTELHAYLSPFPAIQDLTLRLRSTLTADAHPDTALAPKLCRYSGPSKLLPLILRHAAPTDIMLHDDGARGLLEPLRDSDAEARRCITSLELFVDYSEVSDSMLTPILSLFPCLTAVTINISLHIRRTAEGVYPPKRSPMEGAQVLSKPLTQALRAPLALTRAVLYWLTVYSYNEAVPDLEQLKAALLSGVPSLADVSFGGDLQESE